MSQSVYAALLSARQEFDPVLKDSTNPHFKNKYASFSSVLTAVTTALDKHGLILVQTTKVRENGAAILVTELVHVETGQSLDSEYPLSPGKPNDPQALGACLTYARRYSALTILGVAPEDDDGETASGRGVERKKTKATHGDSIEDVRRRIGNCDKREELDRVIAAIGTDMAGMVAKTIMVAMFRTAPDLDEVGRLWRSLDNERKAVHNADKNAAKARLGGGPTRQALQGAT
jgi:hypothetical protein